MNSSMPPSSSINESEDFGLDCSLAIIVGESNFKIFGHGSPVGWAEKNGFGKGEVFSVPKSANRFFASLSIFARFLDLLLCFLITI